MNQILSEIKKLVQKGSIIEKNQDEESGFAYEGKYDVNKHEETNMEKLSYCEKLLYGLIRQLL